MTHPFYARRRAQVKRYRDLCTAAGALFFLVFVCLAFIFCAVTPGTRTEFVLTAVCLFVALWLFGVADDYNDDYDYLRYTFP